ncbi:MAG: DUF1566 domain-containing protein [Flavobacteriales bacterium]|nr:DUF1566 domain-containing protein [Flavobacteriales bacterium]
MSYQAVIRNSSNALVTNQQVGMQISILQGSISGTAVYEETQTPTTNANGLVSVEIGAGTVVSGDFSTIDWANGPYFIKTETDINGGTNYTITGISQLLSVPYALHAKTAESITGGITETDPMFGSSVASGITGADTTYWNNKLDSYTETDPMFGSSVASGITGADTTYWNNKLDSYTETDPVFGSSVASGITGADTTYWNNKLDSYTETDPVFGSSVASGITGADTTYWNNKLDSYTETDPMFGSSVASGITSSDTANWNNKQNQLTAGTGINITNNTVSAKTYSIGDFAHGGIVFWVDETGQHGLVCAKTDQSTGERWFASTYGNTQAKGDGPLAGKANTSIIIAAQVAIGDDGNTYAARICNELQITEGSKTYGDWYLPSKGELNLMYQNKTVINATATANGGDIFSDFWYWSSTEIDNYYAWEQYFLSGAQGSFSKHGSLRFRAVRAF